MKSSVKNIYVVFGMKLIFSFVLGSFLLKSMFKNRFDSCYTYVNFALMMLLMFMLYLTIWKFEKFYEVYKTSAKRQGLWYAMYFTISFAFLYNPLDCHLNEVKCFNRIIGIGLIKNIDVSRRIRNFSEWFMVVGISFILFFLISNYFLHKYQGNQGTIYFLNNLIVIANVDIVLRCITFFYDSQNSSSKFYYSTCFISMLVFSFLAYHALNLSKNISEKSFTQLIIIVFLFSLPISIISKYEWESGELLVVIQFVMVLLCILITKCNSKIFKNKKCLYMLTGTAITFSVIPFATSFYIELINILNQHNIFITHLRKWYFFATFVLMLFTAAFCSFSYKKGWKFDNWKKWVYPWLVFGISCLSCQIALEGTCNADIFESANYSILISDYLNFGSIPLVEHYGGHMMENVWEGLIYAFLNNDLNGAIFSPYSVYAKTILTLLFFYLMRYIWNEDLALLVAMLFPFGAFWDYYGLGMLVCLSVIAYTKNNSYLRAVLLWFTVIWCTIYRLDLGVAFLLACVFTLAIYVIVYNNAKAVKQLLLTAVGWGVILGVGWIIICIVKGINPINRFKEFLMISLSNVNWAYENIGNPQNTIFVWSYIFIPFVVIACLIYSIFSKKIREQSGNEKWIIILVLGFSYLFNFSRGIVRHSLAEMCTTVVIWSAYIFISIFISCLRNNPKIFLPIFTTFILCNTLFVQCRNFSNMSVAEAAVFRIGTFTDVWKSNYWGDLRGKALPVARVKWDENLKTTIEPYKIVMNALLEENETFIDLANKTFVYSAINRKNPAYVSQSPLQLSGEFTQEQFIKEIEGVPLALMPMSSQGLLDGVTNETRYYKVLEYVYQNYIPLCKVDDAFAVWCLSDCYDQMKNKAEALVYRKDLQDEFFNCENISAYNCDVIRDKENNQLVISYSGEDPGVYELQNLIDISLYAGEDMVFSVDYQTDTDGTMEMFYTTNKGENYTASKVSKTNITGTGTAKFPIKITEYTRLRLDVPEKSTVKISSIKICTPYEMLDYIYDDAMQGGKLYFGGLHTHSVGHLPRLWAEADAKKAVNNKVITEMTKINDIYTFDRGLTQPSKNGNYLLISAKCNQEMTSDVNEKHENASVKVGIYKEGVFTEMYDYNMDLSGGQHNYLIRISNDYSWYFRDVNAVSI